MRVVRVRIGLLIRFSKFYAYCTWSIPQVISFEGTDFPNQLYPGSWMKAAGCYFEAMPWLLLHLSTFSSMNVKEGK